MNDPIVVLKSTEYFLLSSKAGSPQTVLPSLMIASLGFAESEVLTSFDAESFDEEQPASASAVVISNTIMIFFIFRS